MLSLPPCTPSPWLRQVGAARALTLGKAEGVKMGEEESERLWRWTWTWGRESGIMHVRRIHQVSYLLDASIP